MWKKLLKNISIGSNFLQNKSLNFSIFVWIFSYQRQKKCSKSYSMAFFAFSNLLLWLNSILTMQEVQKKLKKGRWFLYIGTVRLERTFISPVDNQKRVSDALPCWYRIADLSHKKLVCLKIQPQVSWLKLGMAWNHWEFIVKLNIAKNFRLLEKI